MEGGSGGESDQFGESQCGATMPLLPSLAISWPYEKPQCQQDIATPLTHQFICKSSFVSTDSEPH